MPQAHGGALRTSTPEARSKGGLVTAERRRARAERDEAIDDAVTGHIEKLSAIMGQLVDEAGGEQYRCTCGVLGPKVSKMGLKDAAAVVQMLMTALKEPGDMATIVHEASGWVSTACQQRLNTRSCGPVYHAAR